MFAIDPRNSSHLIIGSKNQLYESKDRGDTWTAIGPNTGGGFVDNSGVTALTYDPTNGNTIYVAYKDGQVWRTTDDGGDGTLAHWTSRHNTTVDWTDRRVSGIAVDPSNTSTLYVTIAAFDVEQIWRSTDQGTTWSNIVGDRAHGGLPNVPVNAILLDNSGASSFIDVGTDAGVYSGVLVAGTWTWTLDDVGLPNVQVLDLQMQLSDAGKVVAAATHGRGVWTLSSTVVGAIINNGNIELGVNVDGNLNVDGGPPSETGTTIVGLRYLPNNAEALGEGAPAEGWGAADATSGTTGYADAWNYGVANLALLSFYATDSTAVSVVNVGGTLQVTHEDYPSEQTPDLYMVTVAVLNISDATVDLRYRRVMDWDIEPTPYDEFVSNGGSNPEGLLVYDNNDGFTVPDPLGVQSSGLVSPLYTGTFNPVGPMDQGALLDFNLGPLAAGQAMQFNLCYGAAPSAQAALQDLALVGAQAYSIAEPFVLNSPAGAAGANGIEGTGGGSDGTPNTFMFGFFPSQMQAPVAAGSGLLAPLGLGAAEQNPSLLPRISSRRVDRPSEVRSHPRPTPEFRAAIASSMEFQPWAIAVPVGYMHSAAFSEDATGEVPLPTAPVVTPAEQRMDASVSADHHRSEQTILGWSGRHPQVAVPEALAALPQEFGDQLGTLSEFSGSAGMGQWAQTDYYSYA